MQVLSGRKKKSNEEIIEQIIMEQYNQYYRLAYSYVHNEPDACDIVQNGAYKALRASHTLRNQEYAKTWVYRIILNEIFNYLKQPRFESYESLQEKQAGEVGDVGDECSRIDLQRALDSLPEQEKVIVTMKYFEDKKLDEIADILNENISTVKSKLYRSMKKLRIQLADDPII